MDRKILNIVRRALLNESKSMCSECGKGSMVEGTCNECGFTNEEKMCSECGVGTMSEGMCSECGFNEGEIGESKKLSKGQKYIARQAEPKDKIGANDFNILRAKKTETKEGRKPDFLDLDKDGNKKEPMKSAAKQAKKRKVKESFKYKLVLDESTNEVFYFDEEEIINIIENVVLEEKKKKTNKLPNVTKSAQTRSKKENDDYIESVTKKMKEYLKAGSKGKYEMKPKHFPKGNGELDKMSKMAYVPSDTAQEYIDNFTAAGLENLDYDEIHPNEDWVEKNIIGSSITGNNPEWGNAVETEVGKRRNKIRKNNLLAKVKRDAYQKDDQPVRYDRTGEDLGDTVDQLIKKYTGKKLKKEDITKNENVILEMEQMKKLMGYNQKTQ
jgi:hypothetical protein